MLLGVGRTPEGSIAVGDITDLAPFRRFGESLAADPTGSLRRITLGARIIEGPDGLRRTELVTAEAVDRVASPASLFPREEARRALIERVLAAPAVPARANQRYAAGEIVEAFLRWVGLPADPFMRPIRGSVQAEDDVESAQTISAFLRADRALSGEAAEALDELIRVMYRTLRRSAVSDH